jgi:hypothetical protein
VSPGSINFGSVVSGVTNTQTVQISNPSAGSVTITAANISGAGYSTSGLNLPLTLSAGHSTTFNVAFGPKSAGAASGSLSFVNNATTAVAPIELSGTGVAPGLKLSVNPSTVNFGNVTVGSSASKSIIVTNTGNSNVSISSFHSSAASLSIMGGSAVTLSPSQSITLTVQFSPATAAATSGSVSIVSNATGSPAAISVSGNGIGAPAQHTVSLSWNASNSAAGYNVYRSVTSGGGYARVNSSVDSAVTFTDSTVQNSQTYYYVTTAVDNTGTESAFSSEVSVTIPN